jgi:hypothetical protein
MSIPVISLHAVQVAWQNHIALATRVTLSLDTLLIAILVAS